MVPGRVNPGDLYARERSESVAGSSNAASLSHGASRSAEAARHNSALLTQDGMPGFLLSGDKKV